MFGWFRGQIRVGVCVHWFFFFFLIYIFFSFSCLYSISTLICFYPVNGCLRYLCLSYIIFSWNISPNFVIWKIWKREFPVQVLTRGLLPKYLHGSVQSVYVSWGLGEKRLFSSITRIYLQARTEIWVLLHLSSESHRWKHYFCIMWKGAMFIQLLWYTYNWQGEAMWAASINSGQINEILHRGPLDIWVQSKC